MIRRPTESSEYGVVRLPARSDRRVPGGRDRYRQRAVAEYPRMSVLLTSRTRAVRYSRRAAGYGLAGRRSAAAPRPLSGAARRSLTGRRPGSVRESRAVKYVACYENARNAPPQHPPPDRQPRQGRGSLQAATRMQCRHSRHMRPAAELDGTVTSRRRVRRASISHLPGGSATRSAPLR